MGSNETKKTLASSFERRYKLTEFVGTIPYMSPEVFFGKPYNCFVDVYSFGMLLYEIVYLKPQFPNNVDYDKVYRGKRRPDIFYEDAICSRNISSMIEKCWDDDISQRPHFLHIHKILKDERKE